MSVPLKPHLVSAPVEQRPPPERALDWGQVALRLRDAEALAAVAEWQALVPVRRIRVPLQGPAGAVLGAVGPGVRVDCEVTPETVVGLGSEAPLTWIRRGVNAWAVLAEESGANALEVVRSAGAAGWPVQLEPTAALLGGALPVLDLLHHYLFHPTLVTPVEPFHGLLVSLLRHRPRPLWFHWFGVPPDYFFVDADGQVSLCAAWACGTDRRYGSEDEPVTAWRASAAHARLVKERARADRTDPACQGCPVTALCGGAIRALSPAPADADCDTWREALERLRMAAGRLQRRGRPTGGSGGATPSSSHPG